jgi:hypothetical protein
MAGLDDEESTTSGTGQTVVAHHHITRQEVFVVQDGFLSPDVLLLFELGWWRLVKRVADGAAVHFIGIGPLG